MYTALDNANVKSTVHDGDMGFGSINAASCVRLIVVTFPETAMVVVDTLAMSCAGGHIETDELLFGTTRDVLSAEDIVEQMPVRIEKSMIHVKTIERNMKKYCELRLPESDSQVPVSDSAVGKLHPGVNVYKQPRHALSVRLKDSDVTVPFLSVEMKTEKPAFPHDVHVSATTCGPSSADANVQVSTHDPH